MKLEIEKAENGYIVKSENYDGDLPKEIKELVADKKIEDFNVEGWGNRRDSETMHELLWIIKEYFLPQSRKHDKHFVEIKVVERSDKE